ncbi:MAG: hypothetical protein H0V53_03030 [Rubrobacter sp.]|nr:hypothetical protein [Rubrobacter sp.]
MAKLPYAPDPDGLAALLAPEVGALPAGSTLYRIYARGGEYPSGWSAFRTFGPLPGSRFDPHPGTGMGRDPEPVECAPTGVLHAACGEPGRRRRSEDVTSRRSFSGGPMMYSHGQRLLR